MSQNISRRQLLSTGLAAAGGTLATAALAAEGSKTPAKGQLTLEGLEKLLAAIGMKTTKADSRIDFTWDAKLEDTEWKMTMSVILSSDESSGIWLTAWLDDLPKSSADVPRTALLRLLAENDKMGKAFFAYSSGNRRFVLNRFVKNENVTTASFKNDMLDLAHFVVETQPLWSVSEWKQPGSAPTSSGKDSSKEQAPSILTENSGAKPIKSATQDAPAGGSARPAKR